MSDGFLDALTGAATLVAGGVFDDADLQVANIASLDLQDCIQTTH